MTALLCYRVHTYSKSINTTGIVKQEQIWETNAIPEATFVSLPKALGTIIVFSPNGMAREQMAQAAKVSGSWIRSIAPRKSNGKTNSRRAVTR